MVRNADGSRITSLMLLNRMDEQQREFRTLADQLAAEMRQGFTRLEAQLRQLPCDHHTSQILDTQVEAARWQKGQAERNGTLAGQMSRKADTRELEELRREMRRYAKWFAIGLLLAVLLIIGADPSKGPALLKWLGVL